MAKRASKRRRLWGSAAALPLAAGAFAFGMLALDAENGLPALLSTRTEVERAQRELVALERRRDELQREIAALEDDEFEVERRAREDLGMIRPGEQMLRWAPER